MLSRASLFFLVFVACAASTPRPAEPWRVEVTTSGGFSGRGVGSYAMNDAGAIEAKSMAGKQCSFTATAEELAKIEALLAATKPEAWAAEYKPADPCCDRVEWTLTLDEAGRKVTTTWIDDPPPMPADLRALADGLRAMLQGRCV